MKYIFMVNHLNITGTVYRFLLGVVLDVNSVYVKVLSNNKILFLEKRYLDYLTTPGYLVNGHKISVYVIDFEYYKNYLKINADIA